MNKHEHLKQIISSYKRVIVAFSAGIDSALVLKVSRDVLGKENVLAVTAQSESVPEWELEDALKLTREFDVEHKVVKTEELQNPSYTANPTNRCYHCKTELYEHLIPVLKDRNFNFILNGTNADDLSDFRPGLEAAKEHEIKSPLAEAGFTKNDVRELAKELNISIWDKPASPCLSSRIPYGEEVTAEKLKQIEAGEKFLKEKGFRIFRLRHYGKRAKVELGTEEFVRFMDPYLRDEVTKHIESLGFKTVYYEPFKSGNLNTVGK